MENLVLIDLVNRFKCYDESSFEPIYESFIGLIRHYSYKSGDEDMIQELSVFLVELLRKIDLSDFSDDNCLRRYIAVALRNRYIFISKQKCDRRIQFYPLSEISAVSWDSVDERVNLFEALTHLSLNQRKVMFYRYLYDYSDVRIATILRISRQAVNRLHNRAIESLRRYYKFKK